MRNAIVNRGAGGARDAIEHGAPEVGVSSNQAAQQPRRLVAGAMGATDAAQPIPQAGEYRVCRRRQVLHARDLRQPLVQEPQHRPSREHRSRQFPPQQQVVACDEIVQVGGNPSGVVHRLLELVEHDRVRHGHRSEAGSVSAQAIIHILDVGEETGIEHADCLDQPAADQQRGSEQHHLGGMIALPGACRGRIGRLGGETGDRVEAPEAEFRHRGVIRVVQDGADQADAFSASAVATRRESTSGRVVASLFNSHT